MLDDIRTRFLSDEDARRIYREHKTVEASSDRYCPTCDKKGSYRWKGEDRECDCQMQLQLHKHYLAAGIGETYQRMTWDDYVGDPDVKASMELYLQQHDRFVKHGLGILLYGGVGQGKTSAVSLLLKDLVKTGYSCYSTTFSAMIEMFTAGWRDRDEQRFFQQKVVRSDVLLLDDVGRELRTRSRLSESTFDDTLRQRVQNARPTFVTTNMTMDEMEDGYGSAIFSLLKEKSLQHEVSGSDFRPKANQRMIDELMSGETRPIT